MIQTIAHRDLKPQSLKFEPKWRDLLDLNHVNQLAIQIAAGQTIPVTVNVENLVLKGRHTAAAYLKVQKGDAELGIAAHPKIKVPTMVISGTPQEERILELSSIVNQRAAKSQELGPALKEMAELLEQQHRARGEKVTKQQVVEEVTAASGKAARTVQKKIREAKPEPERKPSKPRGKKVKIADDKGDEFDGEAFVPSPEPVGVSSADSPLDLARRHLERCLGLIDELRAAQGDVVSALHEIEKPDDDALAARGQIPMDQSVLGEMQDDYRKLFHQLGPDA